MLSPLTVIQTAEYAFKVYQLVQNVQTADEDFRKLLFRGEKMSYAISLYAQVIEKSKYTPNIRANLEDILDRAHEYCEALEAELKIWKDGLDFNLPLRGQRSQTETKEDTKALSRDKRQNLLVEQPLAAVPCRGSHSSLLRPFSRISSKTIALGRETKRLALFIFTRTRYQYLGKMSITEAIHNLEGVRRDLQELMTIAEKLHPFNEPDDIVGFVSIVQRRIKSNIEPFLITENFAMNSVSLDADNFVNFKQVESGEYEGCIMDYRVIWEVPGAMEATKQLVLMLSNDSRKSGDSDMRSDDGEKLAESDEKFSAVGMPNCVGYNIAAYATEHILLYKVPPHHKPIPLRRLLVSKGSEMHSIDDRLDFAINLVTSLHIFHCANMVHKALRPEAILVFEPMPSRDLDGHYILGTPYLAGFSRARLDYSKTNRWTFSEDLKEKIYHHPRHRHNAGRPPYDMEDDIYSLGVCLFEIGMWRSMFRWEWNEQKGEGEYVTDESWMSELFQFDLGIDTDDTIDPETGAYLEEITENNLRADIMKRTVSRMLPLKMGKTYTEVVLNCLTFQDGRRAKEKIDREKSAEKFVKIVLAKLRDGRIGNTR